MIVHQIEALRDAGVTEVVLAINYQPQVMYSFIEEYQTKLGVKISISQVRVASHGCGERTARRGNERSRAWDNCTWACGRPGGPSRARERLCACRGSVRAAVSLVRTPPGASLTDVVCGHPPGNGADGHRRPAGAGARQTA